MVNGIHHIAIITKDKDASLNFYCQFLGFNIINEVYRNERNSWKIDLKCGAIQIELFTFPDVPDRPSYPEAAGLRHLALSVDNVEDVYQLAVESGYHPEQVRVDEFTLKRFFFVADPDGLPIEIYEQ